MIKKKSQVRSAHTAESCVSTLMDKNTHNEIYEN